MVIGGVVDVVGSQSHEVEKTLAEARLSSLNSLSVSLTESDQASATIRICAKAEWPEADVWLIEFDKQHTVNVRRGENSGRQLTYYNVVRNIRKVGTWKGDMTKIPVDLSAIREGGRDGCVVIVQKAHGGPIFGAARLQLVASN